MNEPWREIRLDCPDCDYWITANVRGDESGMRVEHSDTGHTLRFLPIARPVWLADLPQPHNGEPIDTISSMPPRKRSRHPWTV
jgi:hypothetical protein